MVEFSSSLFIGHSTIHMLLSSICRLAAAMLLLCLLCCWRAAAMLLLCCWWAAAMLLLCCCRAAAMLMVWCCYAAATLPLCCCRSAAVVALSIICFIGFGLLYSTMPFRFELFNCTFSPFFATIQRELLDQSIWRNETQNTDSILYCVYICSCVWHRSYAVVGPFHRPFVLSVA